MSVTGATGAPIFGLSPSPQTQGYVHIAFAAESHEHVDDFYRAAITAGGRDNGPPGFRPRYHQHYYAAFVLDPDGMNVEAVHMPNI
jgi:predicted lactoylglutathione lyase